MNNKLLRICNVVLVSFSEISKDMPDGEILNLSKTIIPESHVPGSALLSCENKPTTSGNTFSYDLVYTLASVLTEEHSARIHNAGAVVVKTTQGDEIVLHKNDAFFQNTRPKPAINGNGLKSLINFSITTTKPVI